MMWLARLKTPVAVAAALILATVGVAVQGRQQPAPEGRGNRPRPLLPRQPARAAAAVPDLAANRAIARQQLALIDETLPMLRQLARIGRLGIADPSFSLWRRRRLETLRKTGAGKAEIVAALEETIKSLKEEEAIAEGLKQTAEALNSALMTSNSSAWRPRAG